MILAYPKRFRRPYLNIGPLRMLAESRRDGAVAGLGLLSSAKTRLFDLIELVPNMPWIRLPTTVTEPSRRNVQKRTDKGEWAESKT
ncbi:unnamed protein product [Dovyalis caffra]|uniref:Uncharacterized protein n=1 Tax=Dovyalis caffra TaxID=77055 RepID=A0AAV1RHW0_9ROSI|nr:unnamed protein product [Dovyalis caffra]